MNAARRGTAALALVLAGCSTGAAVEPAKMEAVDAWLLHEQAPLPVKPIAAWYAGDATSNLICGEITAQGSLRQYRSALRYVYYADGSGGYVELHELVTGTDASQATIDAGRRVFDRTWADHCAPAAPIGRRVAVWLDG